jgi:hypothetical protein
LFEAAYWALSEERRRVIDRSLEAGLLPLSSQGSALAASFLEDPEATRLARMRDAAIELLCCGLKLLIAAGCTVHADALEKAIPLRWSMLSLKLRQLTWAPDKTSLEPERGDNWKRYDALFVEPPARPAVSQTHIPSQPVNTSPPSIAQGTQGRPSFKGPDRAIAKEILPTKTALPISRQQAAVLRTMCPGWARAWLIVPGNEGRMQGGVFETKHRRLRDALRAEIKDNIQE